MGHAHHTPSRFIAVMNWTIAIGITHSVVEAEGQPESTFDCFVCLEIFVLKKKKLNKAYIFVLVD
jgi:hypothetical protein